MRYEKNGTCRRIEGPKGGRSTCIKTLLWCEHHGQYSGHIVAMTRAPTAPCPTCVSDNEWYTKAATALWRESGKRATHAEVLARAEQAAGHPLKKYRAHG